MSVIVPVNVIVASAVPSPVENDKPDDAAERDRAVGRRQRDLHRVRRRIDVGDADLVAVAATRRRASCLRSSTVRREPCSPARRSRR